MVRRKREYSMIYFFIEKEKCEKCGSKENLTKHHKIPYARGGTDDPSNIQILCRDCHDKVHGIKRNKNPNVSRKYLKVKKRKWKKK